MDFFKPEKVIEPLIYYYKDMNYIDYILNLSFKDGFKLYLKGIERIRELDEKEAKNHLRQLWLVEIQHGLKDTFEEYCKKNLLKKQDEKCSNKEYKDKENDRIIREIENKKDIKLKERVLR